MINYKIYSQELILANSFFRHFTVVNFRHLGFSKDFAEIDFRKLGFHKDLARINFRDLWKFQGIQLQRFLKENVSKTFVVVFKMVSV